MSTVPSRTSARTRAGTVTLFLVGCLLWFVGAPIVVGVLTDLGPVVLVGLAAVQLAGAAGTAAWWLRRRGVGPAAVGIGAGRWRRDTLLALATVPPRLALELGVLVPLAGGVANEGVQEVLRLTSGGWSAVVGALVLGVVGGGLAEELWFRGVLVGAVPQVFADRRRARAVAVVVSVALFAVLHLPATVPDLVSILVAGATYTALFVGTGRLTAPVVAHSCWNATVIVALVVQHG
ncbi:CPBP family glutamic-type intramembrane protease [Isoptericola sediminis]|uniref:CPBP family intramembrane metalloprotease n=1 Tax=Isoptericola sediminis TaxID=2733572 RepID=A0A849K6H5_9MICO|nr:CPBP family glutamic-type intramembrane protease [Isoptericola sediminis]NNU28040.1 CPBP family intramembrane metalloprotease [Isoptericola sediminis]